jgi:hypothetical protein
MINDIKRATIPPCGELLCQILKFDRPADASIQAEWADEWEDVFAIAAKYRLENVLYNRVKGSLGWEVVPQAARRAIRTAYIESIRWDDARQVCLRRVLEALQLQSLQVIVLKGAFLAESIYQHPAERLMTDIDLLVPLDRLGQAAEVLESLGYRAHSQLSLQEIISIRKDFPPFMQPGWLDIDLHWTLTDPASPYQADLTGIWQRAQPVQIVGTPVLGLGCEDLVLHLCIHNLLHSLRGGLRGIYDLAAVIEHYRMQIDWQILSLRARNWGIERTLFILLDLSVILFNAPVPETVIQDLEPEQGAEQYLQTALELVFERGAVFALPEELVNFWEAPGLLQKAHIVLRRFFPPRSEIVDYYGIPNSWRVWLYYPRRWTELFRFRIGPMLKLFTGDRQAVYDSHRAAQRFEQEARLLHWLTPQMRSETAKSADDFVV